SQLNNVSFFKWLAIHVAALDDQLVVAFGEITHYLCDVNGFTQDESDCGRTSELALESSNSGLFCRNGSQRVLRHGVSSVLTQIATQGRDLIYGETTVFCDYS